MSLISRVLALILVFTLGLIAIPNPIAIARIIVMWAKFVSKDSKFSIQPKAQEAFDLIAQPYEYTRRFAVQIETIQRTGYMAVFIAVIGLCIFFVGGFK